MRVGRPFERVTATSPSKLNGGCTHVARDVKLVFDSFISSPFRLHMVCLPADEVQDVDCAGHVLVHSSDPHVQPSDALDVSPNSQAVLILCFVGTINSVVRFVSEFRKQLFKQPVARDVPVFVVVLPGLGDASDIRNVEKFEGGLSHTKKVFRGIGVSRTFAFTSVDQLFSDVDAALTCSRSGDLPLQHRDRFRATSSSEKNSTPRNPSISSSSRSASASCERSSHSQTFDSMRASDRLSCEKIAGFAAQNDEERVRSVSDIQQARVGLSVCGGLLTSKLGTGSHGSVFLWKGPHGKTEALKFLRQDQITGSRQAAAVARELQCLKRLRHPCIVAGTQFWENSVYIILGSEFAGRTNLFQYLRGLRSCPPHFRSMFRQIISAVAFCHAKRIAHRDIKPENFALSQQDAQVTVKLLDFGLAVRAYSQCTDVAGTVPFVAPEAMFMRYVPARADMFSCGVVLAEILFGLEWLPQRIKLRSVFGDKPLSPSPELGRVMAKRISILLAYWRQRPDKVFCNEASVVVTLAGLLEPKYHERWTAQDASNSPWLPSTVQSESDDEKVCEKTL